MVASRLWTRKTLVMNNTSKTDVAPWCYRWMGWVGWLDWISPGGVMYRAPYDGNNIRKYVIEE